MLEIFATNMLSLKSIVGQFKHFLLSEYGSKTLQSFCYETSKELAQKLKDNGFNAVVVKGAFNIDNPDEEFYNDWHVEDFNSEEEMENAKFWPLHYWVEVDGLIIDMSADQFNGELDEPMPSIVISSYIEEPRYRKDSIQVV